MRDTLQRVYDLTLEIQSAQEAIKYQIGTGFDVYKEQIDNDATKGAYSTFIKKLVSEMVDGKVSEDVKVLENILDYVSIAKGQIK